MMRDSRIFWGELTGSPALGLGVSPVSLLSCADKLRRFGLIRSGGRTTRRQHKGLSDEYIRACSRVMA
jgi:hypothetical protein